MHNAGFALWALVTRCSITGTHRNLSVPLPVNGNLDFFFSAKPAKPPHLQLTKHFAPHKKRRMVKIGYNATLRLINIGGVSLITNRKCFLEPNGK